MGLLFRKQLPPTVDRSLACQRNEATYPTLSARVAALARAMKLLKYIRMSQSMKAEVNGEVVEQLELCKRGSDSHH